MGFKTRNSEICLRTKKNGHDNVVYRTQPVELSRQ